MHLLLINTFLLRQKINNAHTILSATSKEHNSNFTETPLGDLSMQQNILEN